MCSVPECTYMCMCVHTVRTYVPVVYTLYTEFSGSI